MPKSVYDDENLENNSGQQGSSSGSSGTNGSNSSSYGGNNSTSDYGENGSSDGGASTPSSGDRSNSSDTSSELTPSDLQDKEEDARNASSPTRGDHKEQSKLDNGGFYKPEAKDNKPKAGSFFKKNRKRLIGGGVLGGGIVGIIMSLLMLLPLKVQHMVNNLQQNFFASSEQATEDMTSNLLRSYITKKIIPGMIADGRCTSTLTNKDCVSVTEGDGPVSVMYNAWRDAKFEQRLAERGIVIEKRGQSSRSFRLITPSSLDAGGIDLGEFDPNRPGLMESRLAERMDRGEVRREVRKAFENETFAKRVFYRYKVGRFMEKKYGVVRCLVACNAKDDARSKIDEKKLAWKTRFVDRVIMPRSEMYGNAFLCAMEAFRCTEVPNEASEDGTRETDFEESSRAAVNKRDSRNVDISDPETIALAEDLQKNGISGHMIGNIQNSMLKWMATKSLNAVPWIGYVLIASQLFEGLQNAASAAKHLNYVVNSQAMVTTYMMYRTHADEIKTGKLDATLVGSVGESLGPNAGTDQNGGPAESSPYYSEFMTGKIKKGGVASLLNPLTAKAYAATGYPCNEENVTISNGVCPELDLTTSTAAGKAAGGTSKILNTPPFSFLGNIAGLFNDLAALLQRLFDALGGEALIRLLASLVPQHLIELGQKLAEPIVKWFATQFINDAVGDSPSGGRMFDLMAGGADVSGNTYAHYGLGAKVIDAKAAEDIRTVREQEQLEDFEQKSFFARAFDTSSKYSLVSQAAIALPSGTSGLSQSFFGSLLNPFGAIANVPIGLPSDNASAAASYGADLFGVVQYGYPANDPVFTTDPQKYWDDNNCGDPEEIKKWGEKGVVNKNTGIPENNETFGCKLLEASASMSCARLSDDCLTPEELGATTGISSTAGFELRAASFNIFHSTDPNWQARLKRSVNVIEKNSIDIVGLQEVRPDQTSLIQNAEHLGDAYDMWPNATAQPEFNPNPIMWKRDKYTAVGKDYITAKYFGGADQRIPIIKFQDIASGEEFYFANTHDPADARGEAAALRKQNADIYAAYFKNLKQRDDSPVIFTGDFNSGYWTRTGGNNTLDNKRENLTYCILTRDNLFWDAYDASKNKKGECPTKSGIENSVDHIYVSTEVNVSKFFTVGSGVNNNGSDVHDTIIADIGIGNSGGGTDFIIGTYNQPVRGNANAASAKILEHKMDVIGMQELGGSNYFTLRKNLKQKGYGLFPDLNKNEGGHCSNSRTIFYNKEKFNFVKSEIFDVPSYEATKHGPVPGYVNPIDCGGGETTKGGGRANIPIIWLQDKATGQAIIVLNTHNLANCCGGGGERAAEKRFRAAEIYVRQIQGLRESNPGVPVFFTGDFNEGTGVRYEAGTNTTYQRNHNNLLYCMLTKQTKLMFRAAGSSDQPCVGDHEGIGGVDYIYATPGVKVEWTKEFRDPSTNDGPHMVEFARLVVPGAEKASSTAGWSWPLKKSINDGPCYGGPRGHAGMDMNSETADNPVYAMHSGKVVRRGADDAAGNFMTILADAEFGGKPVYYSYEHLKSGSMKFSVGQRVEGGEAVAIAGLTGNVQVSSSKAHLHIVTATTNTLGSYGNLGTTFDPMKILDSVKPAPEGYKCTNS